MKRYLIGGPKPPPVGVTTMILMGGFSPQVRLNFWIRNITYNAKTILVVQVLLK